MAFEYRNVTYKALNFEIRVEILKCFQKLFWILGGVDVVPRCSNEICVPGWGDAVADKDGDAFVGECVAAPVPPLLSARFDADLIGVVSLASADGFSLDWLEPRLKGNVLEAVQRNRDNDMTCLECLVVVSGHRRLLVCGLDFGCRGAELVGQVS